ncbi:unnamed protein product, partial [Staurois parvus]
MSCQSAPCPDQSEARFTPMQFVFDPFLRCVLLFFFFFFTRLLYAFLMR